MYCDYSLGLVVEYVDELLAEAFNFNKQTTIDQASSPVCNGGQMKMLRHCQQNSQVVSKDQENIFLSRLAKKT